MYGLILRIPCGDYSHYSPHEQRIIRISCGDYGFDALQWDYAVKKRLSGALKRFLAAIQESVAAVPVLLFAFLNSIARHSNQTAAFPELLAAVSNVIAAFAQVIAAFTEVISVFTQVTAAVTHLIAAFGQVIAALRAFLPGFVDDGETYLRRQETRVHCGDNAVRDGKDWPGRGNSRQGDGNDCFA